MNQLRRYIRMLVEGAVTGQQAISSGFALYKKQSGDFIQYILYDPNALVEIMDDPEANPANVVKGYIQVRTRSGDCNNASQVKASWSAPGGYGPLMYDFAMADSPSGIMSDRGDTSPSARNVWKFYHDKRKDVKAIPFDDADAPPGKKKTPAKEDDCYLVDDELLDQSYSGNSEAGSLGRLQLAHDTFMKSMGGDRSAAEEKLFEISDDLFNSSI